MHYSNVFVLIASFLTLTIASPSPVRLVPRSCSTIAPTYLQTITEIDPTTAGTNDLTSFFLMQEYEAGTGLFNQVYEVAQFNLPPAAFATGAEPLLVSCFPANYDIFYTIGLSQPPILKAYPLAAYFNDITNWNTYWTWDNILGDLYGIPGSQGSDSFSLVPGECQLIQAIDVDNTNVTPVSGIIAFMFKMVWPTAQSALTAATLGPGAGIFVVYNCFPPF
ncbi:hypothetical protein L207DRAFT_527017 [Hyaloscypha variabilis F]|uniref:Uncharacterized protein n=1 Tax=Hyaloscypha variabilis (strain UAMH 11265 / GT02V1 / F) TaxID=1149755 RepID=A0A2J6RU59_HYAVF|nr:hypothetical protein L207DRAFT_527017 [Hyaloscypha variabilis F]